ncbi:protein of unknown function [Xenorhabdus poinarii G6]|uniref:Uncharacterized protein n=1 Tax=Xenorhabdus poinarii G6 TaxID=1354304 RepID=A0A068R6D0_9GAMM|nr:protein of unknown function [Xenorhabdus poinarii G6]
MRRVPAFQIDMNSRGEALVAHWVWGGSLRPMLYKKQTLLAVPTKFKKQTNLCCQHRLKTAFLTMNDMDYFSFFP